MKSKANKMLTRIVLGGVMIAIVAGLLWLDWRLEQGLDSGSRRIIGARRGSGLYALPTVVVLLAILAAGFVELSRLAGAAGIRLLNVSGLLGALALAGYPYWSRFVLSGSGLGRLYPLNPVMLIVALVLLALFAEQMFRYRTDAAIRQVGATLLAAAYLGVGGALILVIRMNGILLLILFLVAVKFTDIGAYFTGSAIGRHKMIPWLSPGKSWEGLAGGLIVAAGVSAAAAGLLGELGLDVRLSVGAAAVFGAVVGLAGQFGDLCESLLKRSADSKDSGALVPQFGGVLDIIDSPLLAAPVAIVMLAVLQ